MGCVCICVRACICLVAGSTDTIVSAEEVATSYKYVVNKISAILFSLVIQQLIGYGTLTST